MSAGRSVYCSCILTEPDLTCINMCTKAVQSSESQGASPPGCFFLEIECLKAVCFFPFSLEHHRVCFLVLVRLLGYLGQCPTFIVVLASSDFTNWAFP